MLTVAVIRGGPSDEHEVSLLTGATILSHLRRDHPAVNGGEQYRPIDVFIDRSSTWHRGGLPMTPERALTGTDVVWNALHGAYGEDGSVQRLLERLGVSYTGSAAYASSLAFNKVVTKEMLATQGVRMARSKSLTVSSDLDREILELFRTFALPSVIKPATSGSSVGVTVARSFAEFSTGIKNAFRHSAQVLIEEFIKGKEATVGIVDRLRGEERYHLPPIEIVPPAGSAFFDYSAKYSGHSIERCPGNFSRAESDELMRVARLAHESLGLRHYSRSDFIVSRDGIYFLETNALPGLTNESLLPKSLAAVGVAVPDFIDHVIGLAIEK